MHDIRITQILEDGPFGAFCVRCGFFAFHRPIGLLGPCRRNAKSKGTDYRLGRMRRGLHPLNRSCLATPWRMASDLGVIQQVPTHTPDTSTNIVAPAHLPSSIAGPLGPAPTYGWDVAFPEGLDFLEEDCEDC